jgi:membrane-bound serine protease (ClpP class)
MRSLARRLHRVHLLLLLGLLAVRGGFSPTRAADGDGGAKAKPADAEAGPIGQFITISGTVDDAVYGRVSRAALALQARAQQENPAAFFLLEINPGSSPFHQVQGLAKFLTSDLPSLTTVAWIPETLTGNHAVLALACQEIAMHPEAELGDIGLGQPLDLDEQTFVLNLARRRHNQKVSEALVQGMIDRQKELLLVQVEIGNPPNVSRETRVVTRAGYDDLAKAKVAMVDVKPLKEVGAPGVFSGRSARANDILVTHLAQSREELATKIYRLPREAMREDPHAGQAPKAVLIHIDDVIEPILEQFVQRQIERAVADGVSLIIFQIESPGGMLLSSLNLADAIAELHDRNVRTVAYVPKQALSGAAIIALGCDEIYLHPEAMIGDAGPIEMHRGGQFERAPEKVLSLLEQRLKTLAVRKGRPAGLAQAMANKDLAVFEVKNRDTGDIDFLSDDEIHASNEEWEKIRQVPESGRDHLLTLDGRRAHAVRLAEPPVGDFAELRARLGIPQDAKIKVSMRTWVDSLVFVLNSSAATVLLIFLGIVCVYLELHFPTGMFGIGACVCFAIFFWSRFLGGTAGWLEVVLFLLGAGCLAIELFVLPGFGVFGVSGILLMVASLVLASQTFVIPASTGEMHDLFRSLGTLSGALVGVAVLAALFSRYLPSIPFLSEMILTPPGAEELMSHEPRLRPEATGTSLVNPLLERDRTLIGKQGSAMTMLRPAGRAQIGDEFVDVVSEGPFIPAGTPIEIIDVQGTRVVVRRLA